jgi:hypothetical protein
MELASALATHVLHPELQEPLRQNLQNVMELLKTIEELKKEIKNKNRDIDVLYFELANYKPSNDTFDTYDPLSIDDE